MQILGLFIIILLLGLLPMTIHARTQNLQTSNINNVIDWVTNLVSTSDAERSFEEALREVGEENKVIFYPVSFEDRVPHDFPTKTLVGEMTTTEREVRLARLIAEPLKNLIADARTAGHNVSVADGFRSIEDQAEVFNAWIEREQNGGLTYESAYKRVENYSAKPGHSEHHLGTTVDLLDMRDPDDEEEQKTVYEDAQKGYKTGLYGWLRNHAHEYGFVISYPTGISDGESKAGSGYKAAEPWHIRYVGVPLASYLYSNNYLDQNTTITLLSELKKLYSK